MDIKTKRHSLAHILAQAVKSMYPDAKMATGPDIENGFYYDFDFGNVEFKEENLKELEKKMKQIIKQNQTFVSYELPYKEAREYLLSQNEDYKVEICDELNKKGFEKINFYKNVMQNGKITFVDMCSGPHVKNTNEIDINAFKLDKIAGAYWKADEKNKMLTRIYGLAFETPEELKSYLKMIEEAKKRDHRLIGKKMDIFSFSENVGLGLPLWHPMGGRLWRVIEDFWLEEHKKAGYEFVRTPHIGNKKLWETSGHWGNYSDSMYPALEVGQTLEDAKAGKKVDEKESEQYLLKPMNCPFHVEIFKHSPKSYRELPIKWAEIGTVYRYEKKGQLGGLTRVRGFTQDDAHIFCTKEQVKQEIIEVVNFIQKILSTFGMEYQAFLSFREPGNPKYIGNDEMWNLAQNTLKEVSEKLNLNAIIEEGEAAFYGPKIDFRLKDCLGRWHQCSTVQFDFNLPERFDLTYTNNEGVEERPVMIHRALLGSFERFISILIEHYAGSFPLWLAPRQVILIPVSDKFDDYTKKLNKIFLENGIRSEIDFSNYSFNKKIRNAETSKINYILIIGEQEQKDNTVSVRDYKTKKQTIEKFDDFLNRVIDEIKEKKI